MRLTQLLQIPAKCRAELTSILNATGPVFSRQHVFGAMRNGGPSRGGARLDIIIHFNLSTAKTVQKPHLKSSNQAKRANQPANRQKNPLAGIAEQVSFLFVFLCQLVKVRHRLLQIINLIGHE